MFYEKRKKKCWVCGSNKIHKKGKRGGKQRFQCAECHANFTIKNDGVKYHNQFIWFKKWIMERQVYSTLVRDSKMSQSSLQNLFKFYLNKVPTISVKNKLKVHLLIDGSYFANGLCLILYYDHDIRFVQLYRETNQEKFSEIKEDLENLKKLGVQVYSFTCDGHKAILKAIKVVYPEAKVQRCLVHIKRQVGNYLSQNPKHPINRELLRIISRITWLKTAQESNLWLIEFDYWYNENKDYINQKTYNEASDRLWFTHRNLHLAVSLIINAIPNMFCYIDDPEIPNTTNRIESYFPHLKSKLAPHRGLRNKKKKNFIKWYLYFKNKENK